MQAKIIARVVPPPFFDDPVPECGHPFQAAGAVELDLAPGANKSLHHSLGLQVAPERLQLGVVGIVVEKKNFLAGGAFGEDLSDVTGRGLRV